MQPNVKIFAQACAVMLFVGFYVNTSLYPVIVANKGQLQAADHINKFVPENVVVYSLKDQNNIFQFYCNRPVKLVPYPRLGVTKTEAGAIFYVDQDTLAFLTAQHIPFNIIWYGTDYAQENILPEFIDSDTRSSTLQMVYLISKP